jgi:hypothetical protein
MEELTKQQTEIISSIVLHGDISKLNNEQRVTYVKQVCDRLGIDWTTQPFQILKLNGKEKLYATKDATDQLRVVNRVSIYKLEKSIESGLCVFTAYARDQKKEDASSGAVSIEGLKGESLANAIMKAETKAKRRVTLSICGLGMLDENEIDAIPGAQVKPVEPIQVDAHVIEEKPAAPAPEPMIEPTVEDLHEQFIKLLDEYRTLKGPAIANRYLPENWKTGREAKHYNAAIAEIRRRLEAEKSEQAFSNLKETEVANG